MNRTKAQKQEMVTTLAEQVGKSQTIYVTDFTGLNVAHITDLRRRLRAVGVEYVVVKNTLAKRALTESQRQQGGLEEHLAGPTALVLAGADPVSAAKVLTDFAREFEKPAIKIGLVEGKPVSSAQVKSLAALPSKQQLLAQLGGALQAPMAGFLGVLNGLLYSMVGALEALKEQRAAAGAAGAADGAASSQS
jgi:large subunit ribosomal protein L10